MSGKTLEGTLLGAAALHGNGRDLSRAEFVYKVLQAAMQAGHFVGGERIREEEIAEILSVSRTPVREALRRLQATGLLEVAPGRGLSVSVMSRQQMLELYSMREVLEGTAARFAAQHASETEVALLRRLLEECAAAEDDPPRITALNRSFHQAIYDAAHNRYLLGTLREINDTIALLGPTTYTLAGRARSANAEHQAVVEAIARRMPDEADRAARIHIERAKHARLEMPASV